MKKSEKHTNTHIPDVTIDPSLSKYRDKVLFPKKLALANEQLKGSKLPLKKNRG